MFLISEIKKIWRAIEEKNREAFFKDRINRLKNSNFSIISSFCVGGEIYHTLHLRFDSPTINLCFKDDDFFVFAGHIKEYCQCELVQAEEQEGRFPTGILLGGSQGLPNVTLIFVHYASFAEAKEKWETRAKRIHYDNIYIMADKFPCSEKTIELLEKLPFRNKMIFSDRPFPNNPDVFVPSCYLKNGHKGVRGEISYFKGLSGLRYTDEFDWIEFLNRPQ